jgi:hypothetical protein
LKRCRSRVNKQNLNRCHNCKWRQQFLKIYYFIELLICHFLFIWVLHANCLIYPPNYNNVDIVGLQVKADLNNLIVAILKLKLVSAINPPRAGSKIPYLVL